VPSRLADTIVVPSGLNTASVTSSSCPISVARMVPDLALKTEPRPSALAVTTVRHPD
jgi:hypothetical protein